ncbi:MAG: hypothetical protein ACTSWY_06035 [Promethearchaeota archaeon]
MSNERTLILDAIHRNKSGYFDWNADPKYKNIKKIKQVDSTYNYVFKYGDKNILFDNATFFTYFLSLQSKGNIIKKLNLTNINDIPEYEDFCLDLIRRVILKDPMLSLIIAENISGDKSRTNDLKDYIRFLYSSEETTENLEDIFKIEKDIRKALENETSLVNRYIKNNFIILMAIEFFKFQQDDDISKVIRAALELGILDKGSKYYKSIQKHRRENLFIFLLFDKKNRELTKFYFKKRRYLKTEPIDAEIKKWIDKVNKNLVLDDDVMYVKGREILHSDEFFYDVNLSDKPGSVQDGKTGSFSKRYMPFNEIYPEDEKEVDKPTNFSSMNLFEEKEVMDEFENFERSLLSNNQEQKIEKNRIETKESKTTDSEAKIGEINIHSRMLNLNRKIIDVINESNIDVSYLMNKINEITSGGISELNSIADELFTEFERIREIFAILLNTAEQIIGK